jgi:hypothetical protein
LQSRRLYFAFATRSHICHSLYSFLLIFVAAADDRDVRERPWRIRLRLMRGGLPSGAIYCAKTVALDMKPSSGQNLALPIETLLGAFSTVNQRLAKANSLVVRQIREC